MKLRLCPLAAIMSAALASTLAAEPLAPPQESCNVVEIWVDPVHGNDGLGSPDPDDCGGGGIGHEVVRINNPAAPTKTIQVAIDIASKYLRCHYDPVENPDQEAIVHPLPGIYGPANAFNGNVGNGEHFPILMHDRVHLRGVNARRCVIRGVSSADTATYNANRTKVFWPEDEDDCTSLGQIDKQVLIDCTYSGFFRRVLPNNAALLPWASDLLHNQTTESIDSITFQGGDVQVLYGHVREFPIPLRGRVTNCLFDMRHMLQVEAGTVLTGPSMGLAVQQTWVDEVNPVGDLDVSGGGYLPQEVASIGNTFLMAEFVGNSPQGVWLRSRPGAVGILDTCDPLCGLPSTDPVEEPRGVNRVAVQNTLLRTYTAGEPANGAEMSMVGVSFDDANVLTGAQFQDTNAFAIDRAGSESLASGDTHQSFVSPPYLPGTSSGTVAYNFLAAPALVLFPFDVATTPPQTPKVKVWDGNGAAGTQFDPAFVGEYLRTVSPVMGTYRDWRLLPGSPLQDMGFASTVSTFQNGAVFEEPECEPLQVLTWDHEQFGNLRVVDAAPDIGFDEVQLGVMAGSYANHSLSHNRQGVLNPYVPNEQETRFLFLRLNAAEGMGPLAGRELKLFSNEIVAGTNFRAWTNPPGSLTNPTVVSGSDGYRTLYTDISNPVAWMGNYTASIPAPNDSWPSWQGAPGQPPFQLTRIQFQADDEGAAFASWVNVQLRIQPSGSAPLLLGSMQPEFR